MPGRIERAGSSGLRIREPNPDGVRHAETDHDSACKRLLYNSSMTAVYVLRHPETTWNVAERYQGRLDAPLSARGASQARAAADAFRGETLDAVFSSPLGRARHLAERLAKVTGAELRVDQRL